MLPAIASAAKAASEAFHSEGMPALFIQAFGCCRCQRKHYEGDAEFVAHKWHMSKHGICTVPFYYAVWDRYLARERSQQCST